MLTAPELGEYIFSRLSRSAFRLELLDCYEVASDGSDFVRYLSGEAAPTPERKQPWLDRLAASRERGILHHRVHVLTPPLTDYLRYECEWGYAFNAQAGEDIRIIDLSKQDRPSGLVDHDFWLIDDEHPIRMHYDPAGRFLGADPLPAGELPRYQRARDAAVAAGVAFVSWWNRHPQEWRDHPSA